MKLFFLLSVAGFAFVAPSAHASLLTNGDFSSGLTGWTPYMISNGVIGTPTVVNFDVTGTGSNPAARLQVGELAFQGTGSGGGLSQTFSGPAGDYSFSYDFAADASSANGSGGLFSLIFNGTVLNSFNTGSIPIGTERGSLSGFVAGVAAGNHEIRIQATRPFITLTDPGLMTPFQYFDNVVATTNNTNNTSTSVPGPLPLFGAAAAFGYSRKLRKRVKVTRTTAPTRPAG